MARTEYRVLGSLEVLSDGEPVLVPAGRSRLLLATLLLRANHFVSVDELVDRLWDGKPPNPDRAKATLHMVVTRLRQALGDANCVRTMTGGYAVEVEELDLMTFRKLADGGRFAAGLALWRGPVLANVRSDALHRDDVPPLVEERLVVLGRRIDDDLRRGLTGELVPELRSLTKEHPLREGYWSQLMLALYRSGQQADALGAYREIRTYLADELGVEPSPPLQERHRLILNADPALATTSVTAGAMVPRQLPIASSYFVGRDDELRALTDLADLGGRGGSAVVLSAIEGTAGIGKTALAVHWAHQVASRFPDGQLYVNLRGFDPSGESVDPADAIRGFLDAFDIPSARIPVDLAAQAALYRSLLADRRVLVVLDNARDIEQVRPLLPGGAGCLVVITSRSQLTGLVVQEGAHSVTLDVLSPPDAAALVARRLGAARVAAEPDAVTRLIELCDGLPLALAVVAARVATNPRLSLQAMVDDLADERNRLNALDTGDPVTSAQTVFSWSYQRLEDDEARVFRLLSIHSGPDISLEAAVALVGSDVSGALTELTRVHLLTERVPGRFAFHDLIRAYARTRSIAEDDETTRLPAVRRLLDFYLHTVDSADRLLRASRTQLDLPELSEGVQPVVLVDSSGAFAWCETEHANLFAAAELAAVHGLRHGWQLPTAMYGYLHVRQSPLERLKISEVALNAARALGDRFAEAATLHSMGNVRSNLGQYKEAMPLYESALCIREEIGHLHGIAVTLDQMAANCGLMQRFDEAGVLHRHAIERRREQGDQGGLATALNNYAMTLVQVQDYDEAVEACAEAHDILIAAGLDYLLASTLDTMGMLHLALGRRTEAIEIFQRVLDLPEGMVSNIILVTVLENMGTALTQVGRRAEARAHLEEALSILERDGHPKADEVRARIGELS